MQIKKERQTNLLDSLEALIDNPGVVSFHLLGPIYTGNAQLYKYEHQGLAHRSIIQPPPARAVRLPVWGRGRLGGPSWLASQA
jgi:hypothetical protein